MKRHHIRIRIRFKLSDTGNEHECEVSGLEQAYKFKSEIISSKNARFIQIQALHPFFSEWIPLRELPAKIAQYKRQSFVIQ